MHHSDAFRPIEWRSDTLTVGSESGITVPLLLERQTDVRAATTFVCAVMDASENGHKSVLEFVS